jgi:hypothetical protein
MKILRLKPSYNDYADYRNAPGYKKNRHGPEFGPIEE